MDLDPAVIIFLLSMALFGVQLAAIFYIIKLLNYLRRVFRELGIPARPQKTIDKSRLSHLKRCRYCKHRRTYINAAVTEDTEDFYYRCQLSNQPVMLDHSCEKFEFEN